MTTYTENLVDINGQLSDIRGDHTRFDDSFVEIITLLKERESKLAQLNEQVSGDSEARQQLDDIVDEQNELKRLVTVINRALDTDDIDRAFDLIALSVQRSRAIEFDFGKLWQKIQEQDSRLDNHDSLLDDIGARLNRVQQLLDDGHDVDRAVSMAGLDSNELRTILHLDADADLSEEDISQAMVDWMRRTDSAVTEAHTRLTAVEHTSSEVNGRVDRLQTTVREIRETSQSDNSSGALIAALIVGVIAFLLALWFINSRSDDEFWLRFGVSLGFAAIVAGLILAVSSFTGGSKSTSESSSQSTETEEQSTSQPLNIRHDWYRPAGSNEQQQSPSTNQARARAGSDNPSGSSASDVRTTREPAPVGS